MDFWPDDNWFESNKGEFLGGGGARTGYACSSDPDSVIKEARGGTPAPNFIENFVWAQIKDTDLAPLFGEVRAMSKSGRFLLMERLDKIEEADVTPVMPDWMRDVWSNNFGKNAAGEVKCRDYANVSMGETLAAAERYPQAWQMKKGPVTRS